MISKYKNDILEFFATYKVPEYPESLIDALALYTDHEVCQERDRIFAMFVHEIDSIRERRNEGS